MSKALLRFTNPTNIPAYSGWDFKVFAAEIALNAEDMRDVYAAALVRHRRYHGNIPPHPARSAEADRVAELHEILVAACDIDRDVTLDGHNVWAHSSGLMFGRRFVSVSCPECRREYGPDECQVVEWAFGGGLAAEGGRRVVCPADHTLYLCGEWNS